MHGNPEHRPRITDYQYVMALVCPIGRSSGLWPVPVPAVPRDLRRMAAKGGPRQKSRPGQPYEERRAVFMGFTSGIPPTLAPSFAPRGAGHAGDSDVGLVGVVKHAPGSGLVRRQGGQTARSPFRLLRMRQVVEHVRASKRAGRKRNTNGPAAGMVGYAGAAAVLYMTSDAGRRRGRFRSAMKCCTFGPLQKIDVSVHY
jgi:hypothetical protein